MGCVGGGGEGGEDLGDVEGHFFFFFVLPRVVVFEGPSWEETGRNFVRFPECDVASFFLLLLLLLGLAGCLSLARSLACYYNTIATAIDAVQKGYVVSSLATSVKVASKIKSS